MLTNYPSGVKLFPFSAAAAQGNRTWHRTGKAVGATPASPAFLAGRRGPRPAGRARRGALTAGERDSLPALTLMVDASTSPAQLGDLLGSRPAASIILKGVREPRKAHVRNLARHFKLSADDSL